MKQCKKCGELLPNTAKHCTKCGAKQGGIPTIVKVLIIIFVVLGCLFGCVAACTAGLGKAVNDAIDEVEKSYDDKNGKTEFNVGETFENKSLKVQFISSNSNFTNYSQYATVKSGFKVVQYTFKATNVGDDQTMFDYTDFNCYSGDTKREQFYSVEGAGLDTGGSIDAGKSLELSIYCEVEKDSVDNHVMYSPFLSDTKIKFNLEK